MPHFLPQDLHLPYPMLPSSTPSVSFPEYPTLHKCPLYIAQLIDPAIRSWNLGPGFCTRDNLFGVAYLVVLGVNYLLAVMAFYVLIAVLRRVVCCTRAKRERVDGTAVEGEMSRDARAVDRAERGEGGWVGKQIKAYRPVLSPVREKEKM